MKRSFFLFSLVIGALFVVSAAATTITITSRTLGYDYDVLKGQISIFESQNPDIKVRISLIPNSPTEIYKLYMTYFSSQSPEPDILMIESSWSPVFSDFLVPLDGYFTKEELKDFFPSTIEANTWNGRLMAVPLFLDTGILYYRKDLLEKYGFVPPETWDELVNQAETISKNEEIFGYVWQGAAYEGLTSVFEEFVHSYGGTILAPDGDVTTDSDMARAALQMMTDMIRKYKVSPLSVSSYMEESVRNAFQSGNAVFMRNWLYCWPLLNGPDSNVAGKVGIERLPMGTGFTDVRHPAVLGGFQLCVNKNSANLSASVKFLKFLVSSGQELGRATSVAYIGEAPSRVSVYDNPEFMKTDPIFEKLKPIFENAKPGPKTRYYPELSDIIFTTVQMALVNRMTVNNAINSMTKQIKELLGR